MIELHHDGLTFYFPGVLPTARCTVEFQRTLRIPDDNRDYPLPPGIGRVPLLHVDDFASKLPAPWVAHGGVLMPMYRAEAMWLRFETDAFDCAADDARALGPDVARLVDQYVRKRTDTAIVPLPGLPCAIKVAAGKINAITGDEWFAGLGQQRQDYAVLPDQPWLDGFCVGKGLVRQFVAMPLGEGYTAEEQITGAANHGGLQVAVYPMRKARYREQVVKHLDRLCSRPPEKLHRVRALACAAASPDLGLAPGGLMRQEIYTDPHGVDAWDVDNGARCFVHMMDAAAFAAVTGARPPQPPVTAADYTAAGLPWFDYYADAPALEGLPALQRLDSVAARSIKVGAGPLPDNEPVVPRDVRPLGPGAAAVRQGDF